MSAAAEPGAVAAARGAAPEQGSAPPGARVRAWDLPTRLFKWALVLLVAFAWASQEWGAALGDYALVAHRTNGTLILVLLVFRLLWGLFGSSTARFSTWVRSPLAAARYLLDVARGKRRPFLGHNPAGSYVILGLLGLAALQGTTGLFTADSNGLFGGPFAATTPGEAPTLVQARLQSLHFKVFWVLLGLVVLHALTNTAYQLFKKEPLVTAMVIGTKPAAPCGDGAEPYEDEPEMRAAPAWRAVACLAAALVLVYGTIGLLAPA